MDTIFLAPDEIRRFIESRALPAEMSITLTEEAFHKAQDLIAADPNFTQKSLRVYIEGKGCDGFYYGVSFDDPMPQDFHFPREHLDVVVDPESLHFLFGSTVGWVNDERGTGFLVENPNHDRYRGKFYKKKSWVETLEKT